MRQYKIAIVGEAIEIPLSRNLVAFISPEDYANVSKYKWYSDVGKWTTYAKTDQPSTRPRLHRFIMQPTVHEIVHHKDGNGLNNTRDNLLVCAQTTNVRYSKKRAGTKSIYRGVWWHNQRQKWAASITVNYEKINLKF